MSWRTRTPIASGHRPGLIGGSDRSSGPTLLVPFGWVAGDEVWTQPGRHTARGGRLIPGVFQHDQHPFVRHQAAVQSRLRRNAFRGHAQGIQNPRIDIEIMKVVDEVTGRLPSSAEAQAWDLAQEYPCCSVDGSPMITTTRCLKYLSHSIQPIGQNG